MKQSVILKSPDRMLFGIIVDQDTKTSFLSVTDLQKAYEIARWQHGWSERAVSTITKGKEFQERLFYLLSERGIIKMQMSTFIEMIEKEGLIKSLKGINVWKSSGARGTNKVMCDPYIWVLLAMEMNPMIYAKVVMWLTDALIFNRIEAGTEYLPMNQAIKSIVSNPDYGLIATEINKKVFGHHQSGMRNLASAPELRKITDIEKFIIKSIEMGFIKNSADILKAISAL